MPEPSDIAKDTLDKVVQSLGLGDLAVPQRDSLLYIIQHGVNRESLRSLHEAWNAEPGQVREAMLARIDPEAGIRDANGNRIESNTQTKYWTEWFPGLNNDQLTLRQALDSLPGLEQTDVPDIVKLFENPESPVALKGAVKLDRHDAIHILIGRGLVDQDEAFVLGFTLGTRKNVPDSHRDTMRKALELYPEPFKITGRDLLAFDLGISAGRLSPVKRIYAIELESMLDMTLGEIREQVGIDKGILREFYRLEQVMIPGTPASVRLPIIPENKDSKE